MPGDGANGYTPIVTSELFPSASGAVAAAARREKERRDGEQDEELELTPLLRYAAERGDAELALVPPTELTDTKAKTLAVIQSPRNKYLIGTCNVSTLATPIN